MFDFVRTKFSNVFIIGYETKSLSTFLSLSQDSHSCSTALREALWPWSAVHVMWHCNLVMKTEVEKCPVSTLSDEGQGRREIFWEYRVWGGTQRRETAHDLAFWWGSRKKDDWRQTSHAFAFWWRTKREGDIMWVYSLMRNQKDKNLAESIRFLCYHVSLRACIRAWSLMKISSTDWCKDHLFRGIISCYQIVRFCPSQSCHRSSSTETYEALIAPVRL